MAGRTKRDPADDLLAELGATYGGGGGDTADALLSELGATYGAADDGPGFRMVPAAKRVPGPWAGDYEGARPAPPVEEPSTLDRIGHGVVRVAEGIGTAAGDVLDTVSAGGYRRLRDAIGDRIAPDAMAATRAAEHRVKSAPLVDVRLPIEARGAVGDFLFGEADAEGKRHIRTSVGDVTSKAGYFLPVGAPGRAMEAARNAVGAARATTRLGRIGQAAKAGAAGGAVQGAAEATVRTVGDNGDLAGWLEEVALNVGAGTLFGGGTQAAAETAGAGAGAIRNAKNKRGEHIRALEADGADIGVFGIEGAPSKRHGVEATSEGRGEVGERVAGRLVEDLDAQDAALSHRLNREDLPRALEAEGDRLISTDPYIARIDEMLATPEAEMLPGARSKLETARRVLAGEMEPSIEVFTPGAVEYHNSPRAAVGRTEWDAGYGVRRRLPVEPSVPGPQVGGRISVRGNEVELSAPQGPQREVYESLEMAPRRTTEEAYTVHSGGGDPIHVGVGDVRGRVGEGEPNYVMTAAKLNKVRDILDDLAGMDARESGIGKDKMPVFKLANELRAAIGREAPAIAEANARFSADKQRIERARELMKTEDSESLGMQLASLGEPGNKSAGSRKVRLGKLRDEFPTDGSMTREQLEREFNKPRALLAEEHLAVGVKLPRISSGGKDSRSWPVVARGLYPLLNKGARHLARTPGADVTPPVDDKPSKGLLERLLKAQAAISKGATRDPVYRAYFVEELRNAYRAEQVKRHRRGLAPLPPLPPLPGEDQRKGQ